ncbi:hypothetical protein FB451DRAFT_1162487 [Mycena latifolia]|nr:hypothetical protein FB451DRAFT_1162487 [Mycena latifolia]
MFGSGTTLANIILLSSQIDHQALWDVKMKSCVLRCPLISSMAAENQAAKIESGTLEVTGIQCRCAKQWGQHDWRDLIQGVRTSWGPSEFSELPGRSLRRIRSHDVSIFAAGSMSDVTDLLPIQRLRIGSDSRITAKPRLDSFRRVPGISFRSHILEWILTVSNSCIQRIYRTALLQTCEPLRFECKQVDIVCVAYWVWALEYCGGVWGERNQGEIWRWRRAARGEEVKTHGWPVLLLALAGTKISRPRVEEGPPA